ncbi:signal peptidase complex catalytic subunit [Saccharomycopsis crataegensis]|uniref:Signal peptidase complex catalytic subunit SEC11 n=1 Tax=Saccharomycopsis crataegensis TaxID=43959 RepID=A0AAV5QW61_9ASCO|nr:signal peptidase complex catalytic subunit [Saccharomycopsis crataegensis]
MMHPRQLRQQIHQGLNFGLVLASAFMFWKFLSVLTSSESPVVVVLSGSMEPAFQRGDVLFLYNRDNYVDVGDIVVYQVKDKSIPIVHRVMNEHHIEYTTSAQQQQQQQQQAKSSGSEYSPLVHTSGGKQLLLTKGDNNPVNDLGLYGRNQGYLNRDDDILGVVKGYVPFVGYITILITENVYLKYAMIGFMAISALLSNEE